MKRQVFCILAVLLMATFVTTFNYGRWEMDESGFTALTKSIAKDARYDVSVQRGPPENAYTYISEDCWSERWWYWSQGIRYTFKKTERFEYMQERGCGRHRSKRIDVVIDSIYTFNPIR